MMLAITRSYRNEAQLPLAAFATFLVATLAAMPALAHIDIDAAGSHRSRHSGSGLKVAPCGEPGTRGTNVYTYRPGSTINIKVNESIPHPSYFRISFDDDGDDDFVIPTGTAGEFGNCAGNPNCGPGREDYCSNETVLLDHLDPHAPGALNQQYTWSVTLPNIECDNCTLQVIQMMNDFAPFHSPADYPADDIYYHCIDLVLTNDPAVEVDDSGGPPVQNNGMVCRGPDPMPDGGPPIVDPGADAMAPPQMPGTGGVPIGMGSGGIPGAGGSVGVPPASAGGNGGVPIGTGGGGVPAAAGGPSSPGAGGNLIPPSAGGTGVMGAPMPPASGDDDGGGCRMVTGTGRRPSASAWLFAMVALLWRSSARRRSV